MWMVINLKFCPISKMMQITKTTIEVNLVQFKEEIKKVCERVSNHNRSRVGTKFNEFRRELGLKITELQFFDLCVQCGIEVRRNIIFHDQFKQI